MRGGVVWYVRDSEMCGGDVKCCVIVGMTGAVV